MKKPIIDTAAPVTLDAIFKSMSHWRDNKHQYKGRGIPDNIWHMFFDYEQAGHSANGIRRMFSLSTAQYKKKYKELCGPKTPPAADVPTTEFCEAVVKSPVSSPVPPLTSKVSDM